MKDYLTYDDVLLLPNYSEVTPSKTDVSSKLTNKIKLEVPIIAAPMDTVCEKDMALELGRLGGYGIIHRNLSIVEQADQVKFVLKKKIDCGAAVGVGMDIKERVRVLVKTGIKEICVDSAHGHTKHVGEVTRWIKQKYKLQVISGNVATYEGVEFLFKKGADAVKVGMGPGSICTTRVMSGMGAPQLTAVMEGVRAAKKYKKRLIADGGIKTSGDIVKALAAGADTVMIGSLLAGTDEAPGEVVEISGKLYKSYRGMGSVAAMKKGSSERYSQTWKKGETKRLVPEGVEGLVGHKGSLEEYMHQLVGGLRAGMGYLGAKNLSQLRSKHKFIKITNSGLTESKPHSILFK